MNYLGHLSISNQVFDIQVGNITCDLCKGKPWQEANEKTMLGFLIHKEIDKITDSHPNFSKLGKMLFPYYRHYSTVINDLLIDHYLSKNWSKFHNIEMTLLIDNFFQNYHNRSTYLPKDITTFIESLESYHILSSYATADGLEASLVRIEKRCRGTIPHKRLLSLVMPFAKEVEEICLDIYSYVLQEVSSRYFTS